MCIRSHLTLLNKLLDLLQPKRTIILAVDKDIKGGLRDGWWYRSWRWNVLGGRVHHIGHLAAHGPPHRHSNHNACWIKSTATAATFQVHRTHLPKVVSRGLKDISLDVDLVRTQKLRFGLKLGKTIGLLALDC